VPTAEIEGQMGELQIGLQARLMSQALRKLTGLIRKSNCTAVFINQLREKVGVVFGNPETTPGGRALKFYSSVRIDLRRIEPIKNGTDIVGNKVRARIVKNKMAPPFKKAEMDIIFSEGISKESSLIDLGVEKEIITKSGSFFSYGDVRLGQGRDSTRRFLKEEKTIAEEIEKKIRDSAE
jgi:recombination protein RecA